MDTAWRHLLRLRRPVISSFVFSTGALMVHPNFQDWLLFSDIAALTPENLFSRLLKHEGTIIEWLTAVDNVVILQLARMFLHPAAVLFPESGDLWKWGRRRPPATILDSVDDFCCRHTEDFNGLSFRRPLAMWSTDEAFVEVKCSVCKELFSTASAAVRHFNTTKRCLPAFQEKPDCLSVPGSLSSVALIVVSGRPLSGTKADDMDNGWELFRCVCCELVGEKYLGSWRACIKHFDSMGHSSLPIEQLNEAAKLFRLATVTELDQYTGCGRVWACSRCHDFERTKATRSEIIAHVTLRHVAAQPSIPGDYHYTGMSETAQYFGPVGGVYPEACLQAVPYCAHVTGRRYSKEHMVNLLTRLPVPCPVDNPLLLNRVEQNRELMIVMAASRTYYYSTLTGRFLRVGIRPSTKALNLLEKSDYCPPREKRLSERDWRIFMDIFSMELRPSIVSKTMNPRSRRSTMLVTNIKLAWNIFLRQNMAPAASRRLFPEHIAVLHPKIRDHLLLRDTKSLRPNHLVELFQKHESALVDWVYDMDDSLFLQLANADLQDVALSFLSRADLYDFMNRRPPATVFARLHAFSPPRNAKINAIYLHRPSMWTTSDAFVEIRCFACSQVFVSSSAAIRHFDRAMGCLESYQTAPNSLVIQKSLASVALVLISGRLLTGTKAEEMDDDWKIFVCMCCVSAHVVKPFVGSWRASVKHFEEYNHASLSQAELSEPSKLFRIATTMEIDEYMEGDGALEWCCSHCHESLDKKLTSSEIILHLEHMHLVLDPKMPRDMFYGGV
ncbi:hypothetical protein PM082_007033 [Marasmius tenuissimus]|nr:hypothetical protein PM082_007033 [Marasmius tenuissimus]